MRINSLDGDALVSIWRQLDLQETLLQGLVCRYFLTYVRSDDVWKPLCLGRWPWLAERSGAEGWRRLFDKGTAYQRLVEGEFFKKGMPHHFLIKANPLHPFCEAGYSSCFFLVDHFFIAC